LAKVWKPTKQQLAQARGKKVSDLIRPGLKVLFCGINPGLYSGAVGHHFARPGNRFWPAMHAAGFSDRILSPFEERELLDRGWGITNLVERASGSARELTDRELIAGARRLKRKVRRYHPAIVAFVGITAYRKAFGRAKAALGWQPERLAGSAVWILPNPSGLNAHFQVADFARMFKELRLAAEADARPATRKRHR
jgi:TDG/mug DNA glycosylase family protein